MLKDLKKDIYNFINKNSYRLFFLLICVAIGLICGALFSAGLPEDKADALTEYVITFGTSADNGELTYISVLKNQVLKSVRTCAVLTICSLSIILIPVILVNSFSFGFAAGFTLGFMSVSCGFGGFVMAVVSVLPEFIITLPGVLVLSVLCLNHALHKSSLHNIQSNDSGQRVFFKKFLATMVFILIGNVVNSLVITEFSKFAGGLIIR